MKIVKLFLPGQFEDAFIYMGRLIALTRARTLRVYNLSQIVPMLEARYPQIIPVLTLSFLQNKWLTTDPLQLLVKNNNIAATIRQVFDQFPQPFLPVPTDIARYSEEDLRISARSLLDILIYNKRLYIGADTGLYNFDLDWAQPLPPLQGRARQRLEATSIAFSAGYGTVNVSCANNGLFSLINDFDQVVEPRPHIKHFGQHSLRSSWLNYNLINYSSSITPTILRGEHKKAEKRDEQVVEELTKDVVTDLDEEPISLSTFLTVLRNKHRVQPDAIQYVYNSAERLFVNTFDGRLYAVEIRVPRYGEPQAPGASFTIETGGRVITASTIQRGLVIELENNVALAASGEWYPVVAGEAISVRTFPRSKDYQHVLAVTLEDGVVLAAIFDEALLGDQPIRQRQYDFQAVGATV